MGAFGRGTSTPQVDQLVPLNHLELDLDADLGQALLDELVHRQRQHLARTRRRDQDLGLDRFVGTVAGLLHQLLRLGEEADEGRSEEHTSELQSLMRISYAVFCLKKKKHNQHRYKLNIHRLTTTDIKHIQYYLNRKKTKTYTKTIQ